MNKPIESQPLPDLPWSTDGSRAVVSARGYHVAQVDPNHRFPADNGHRIAQLIAAAPETAEKLRELAAAAEELLAVVMIQNGNLHADINEMTARARAALARARGA